MGHGEGQPLQTVRKVGGGGLWPSFENLSWWRKVDEHLLRVPCGHRVGPLRTVLIGRTLSGEAGGRVRCGDPPVCPPTPSSHLPEQRGLLMHVPVRERWLP